MLCFRLIGKYNPGHGVCYVSEEGVEKAVRDFQVLVAFHGSKPSAAALSGVKKALALEDESSTTERSGIFVTSPVSKLWAKKTSKNTFRKRLSANYNNSFSLRPLLRSMRYDIWSPFNISVTGNVCLTKLSFELISPFNAIHNYSFCRCSSLFIEIATDASYETFCKRVSLSLLSL